MVQKQMENWDTEGVSERTAVSCAFEEQACYKPVDSPIALRSIIFAREEN